MSTQLQEEVLLQEKLEDSHDLMVYNDDVNSFDHVIETLINICEHTPEQAEQCTWIIHHKGKCSVKNGEFDFLKELRSLICQKGISAEIL
jgi:ATP-dependent Clp protease adaptor protein ClpS